MILNIDMRCEIYLSCPTKCAVHYSHTVRWVSGLNIVCNFTAILYLTLKKKITPIVSTSDGDGDFLNENCLFPSKLFMLTKTSICVLGKKNVEFDLTLKKKMSWFLSFIQQCFWFCYICFFCFYKLVCSKFLTFINYVLLFLVDVDFLILE